MAAPSPSPKTSDPRSEQRGVIERIEHHFRCPCPAERCEKNFSLGTAGDGLRQRLPWKGPRDRKR